MKTLESYLTGRWCGAASNLTLVDPSTEQVVATATSSAGEVAAAVTFAREVGVPALAALTFAERGELLKGIGRALKANRDELLALSRSNNGTTSGDGSFDIDGAGGTLAYYAALGASLGNTRHLVDGDGAQLGRSEAFWTRHLLLPRGGIAVHVNAFNFPAWGLAEKFACAILAGTPVITKPATATALLAHRIGELIVESGILPAGAFQLLIGPTGDLLDRLDGRDVFAFTGSAATANALRGRSALLNASVRVNVEADSVNAAVLGPDAEPGSKTFDLFIKDVVREITQKAGQKCTAIRRILVPANRRDAVAEALVTRLAGTTVGNPADESVRMGPVATADQLDSVLAGIATLSSEARLLCGGGRVDGIGAEAGKGFFVAPTLFAADDARSAKAVHEHEVFGPCATILPVAGSAADAAAVVALGGGTLLTSAYTDDAAWLGDFVAAVGGVTGRVYVGSSASEGFGSGAALPGSTHGGPGRAGGGEELGGQRGLAPYFQRVALQGDRAVIDEIS